VRNPGKLPAEFIGNANVSVVKGTLEDRTQWLQAAACGATIFVSFAGPTLRGAKGTVRPLSQVYMIWIEN
jgi:hypothetical protein